MHIEIQVALNFVISYLYNKLPRRRVNIFGEELEKALKDKFQGHWYPEKPFKGSAFRCLKTGDPIDSVLERAARESGVPIADILENLPSELSVWVDPGEVSYRIGEKGAVKILYSENSDNHEDNTSADREVNKTFNPEAQCFRPIDAVNTSMNNLSLSPKTSPHSGSSPHSASSNSPTYKGSPNPVAVAANGGGGSGSASFMQRNQAPLTFTTATFAQTKFGSTKLKTSSKRANSSSTYRMSPTEFSNYIKQRAMQQQMHHGHGPSVPTTQPNHFGPIGPISPARSLSPNPLSMGMGQNADPFYFPNMSTMGMYPQFNSAGAHRNLFDAHFQLEANGGLYGGGGGAPNGGSGHNKYNGYLEPHGFYGMGNHMQQQPHLVPPKLNGNAKNVANNESCANKDGVRQAANNNSSNNNNNNNSGGSGVNSESAAKAVSVANGSVHAIMEPPTAAVNSPPAVQSNAAAASSTAAASAAAAAASAAAAAAAAAASTNQDSNSSKLIDGLNSFYSNATGSYQQLLVAN